MACTVELMLWHEDTQTKVMHRGGGNVLTWSVHMPQAMEWAKVAQCHGFGKKMKRVCLQKKVFQTCYDSTLDTVEP